MVVVNCASGMHAKYYLVAPEQHGRGKSLPSMSIVPINVSSRAEAAVARANRAVVRIMFIFGVE